MEMGQSSGKEVSYIPTTPLKPILPRTEPICADGRGSQLTQASFMKTSSCASPHASYTDSVVACAQSSPGARLHMKMQDPVESTPLATSIGGDSAGPCARPTAVAVSGLEGVSFSDLLALADSAARHFGGTTHPGTKTEGKNSLFPESSSQSDSVLDLASVSSTHHNVSLEQNLLLHLYSSEGPPIQALKMKGTTGYFPSPAQRATLYRTSPFPESSSKSDSLSNLASVSPSHGNVFDKRYGKTYQRRKH